LFCDRQPETNASQFLAAYDRLRQPVSDAVRYTLPIVFHTNVDETLIVAKCNINSPRRRTVL
jgi:hypothetical protein